MSSQEHLAVDRPIYPIGGPTAEHYCSPIPPRLRAKYKSNGDEVGEKVSFNGPMNDKGRRLTHALESFSANHPSVHQHPPRDIIP